MAVDCVVTTWVGNVFMARSRNDTSNSVMRGRKKRPSMRDVKFMASLWGDHTRRGVRGLSYPSITPIARLTLSPGRSTMKNYSPSYEPCPVSKRFEKALERLPKKHQRVIRYRYVDELSDLRIVKHDGRYRTEGQARWAGERALREIRNLL